MLTMEIGPSDAHEAERNALIFSPRGFTDVICGSISITLAVVTDEDGISPTSTTSTATPYESNDWLAGFSEVDSYDVTIYYSYEPSGPFNPLSE